LARPSSNNFYDLMERIFCVPRRAESLDLYSVLGAHTPIAKLFSRAKAETADELDSAWLGRIELSSPAKVSSFLDNGNFRERPRMLNALFVDRRCGLICREVVGPAAAADVDVMVRETLRLASSCHASGIILATYDPDGKCTAKPKCREMISKLQRKGEAIQVPLLNYLVRTTNGWTEIFAVQNQDQT